jgi:molecular chaperone HscB
VHVDTRSGTEARTLQQCRECGAGAPLEAHVCPQCRRVLPIPRGLDYYSFFGLPRLLTIDASELETRYRALSRQFHPDYFYNASASERRASLERSSYLNDAFRTLKQPVARAEYLLKLEGVAPRGAAEAASQVPPALLEEVFALNEELEEVRSMRGRGAEDREWRGRLDAARRPIERKRHDHEQELARIGDEWDALVRDGGSRPERRRVLLEALRERMLERNYINNLLASILREMEL